MALSKEDHHDVSKAFGKAIAKKISHVTRDRYKSGGMSAGQRIERSLKDEKEGKARKVRPILTSYSRTNLRAFGRVKSGETGKTLD